MCNTVVTQDKIKGIEEESVAWKVSHMEEERFKFVVEVQKNERELRRGEASGDQFWTCNYHTHPSSNNICKFFLEECLMRSVEA